MEIIGKKLKDQVKIKMALEKVCYAGIEALAPGWMLSSTPAFGVNHAVHTFGGISDLMPWDDGDPHTGGQTPPSGRLLVWDNIPRRAGKAIQPHKRSLGTLVVPSPRPIQVVG